MFRNYFVFNKYMTIGIINDNIIYPVTKLVLDPVEKLNFSPNTVLIIVLILRLACIYLIINNIKINNVLVIYILSVILLNTYVPLANKKKEKYKYNYNILLDLITHFFIVILLLEKFDVISGIIITLVFLLLFIVILLKHKCNKSKVFVFNNKIVDKIYELLVKNNIDCKYKNYYNLFGSGLVNILVILIIVILYKK